MILRNQKITFHYGAGFDQRLLTGYLSYGGKQDAIEYTLSSMSISQARGEYPIAAGLKELMKTVLSMSTIDGIKERYNGSWDDVGSSSISFCFGLKTKTVTVSNVFDRASLKTSEERIIFDLIYELRLLFNEIYSDRLEDDDSFSPRLNVNR